MKILFYINAIHHGGAERVMVNLANYFSMSDNCVLVTSFKDEWEYSVSERVKRVVLSNNIPESFFKRNILLVKKLRSTIIIEKPDVIISFMAEPNFRSIISSFGQKIPTIISIRNDPRQEYPNMIFKLVAKILYPFASGIVFQTIDAKKSFSKLIQRKSAIIYNPVDEEFYNQNYRGERNNIVTTGRLTGQKNHKLLIKAFAKISSNISDNLYIYGDGELKDELQLLINKLDLQGRAFLMGAIQNVPDTIKNAKLFVLSSDYEGMPNSLMEAMALGVPCISTDCPCGGPAMLLKGKYITPVCDEDSLSNAMLDLLLSDEKNAKASNYVKTCAKAFYPSRVYKKWRGYIWQNISKKWN